MRISLHGGNCCGIKHIHELGYSPNEKMAERTALSGNNTSFGPQPVLNDCFGPAINDMRMKRPRGNEDFFCDKAPEETYRERLLRLIAFIKAKRPHGAIEIVLSSSQSIWFPILRRHGFKTVSKGKNSNTSSTIYIFHHVY